MLQFKEWSAAVRENGVGVVTAVVAVGAIFGLEMTAAEGNEVVDSIAKAVAAVGAVVVSVNVVVGKFKAAWKADTDIDTGSSTPGPGSK